MARYIDADEAMQIINNYAKAIDYDCDNCKVVIDAIKDIVSVICPTADVVEVVRCCECKYSEQYKCTVDPCYNHMSCKRREHYTEGVDAYDFCSYGERKSDG